MDTLHKMQVYQKLYNKYAPNLTEEEINQGVNTLAGMLNQQQAVQAFFKKYTGNDPDIETQIKLSSILDPDSTQGIIDAENKRISEHNAKLEQEEKDRLDDIKKSDDEKRAKYEKHVDEVYKEVSGAKGNEFNIDVYRDLDDDEQEEYKTFWDNYSKLSVEDKEKYLKDNSYILTNAGKWQFADESAGNWSDQIIDGLGNRANAVKNFLGNWFGGQSMDESYDEATARYYLDEAEDERRYKEEKNPNYYQEKLVEHVETVKEKQKELLNLKLDPVKNAEQITALTEEIETLKKNTPTGVKLYEVKEVQDFRDTAEDLITGQDAILGWGGTTNWFYQDSVDEEKMAQLEKLFLAQNPGEDFTKFREYLERRAVENTLLEGVTQLNLDPNVEGFDGEANEKIEEAIRAAVDNYGFDETELRKWVYATGETPQESIDLIQGVGAESKRIGGIQKLFAPRYDELEKDYNKSLVDRGFRLDTWMDDEYVKIVFKGANDDEVAEIIQGQSMEVTPTEAAIDQYKQYLDLNELEQLTKEGASFWEKGFELYDIEEGQEGDLKIIENKKAALQRAKIQETIDAGYAEAIGNDPIIQMKADELREQYSEELKAYAESLKNQYDMSNDDDVMKVNELYEAKYNELILGNLVKSDEYKKRATEIGFSFAEIGRQYDVDFTRQQSWYTRTMDSLYDRRDFDWYNPIEWAGATLNGIGSGVEGITTSIGDQAVASFQGYMSRAKVKKLDQIKEAIDKGELDENSKIYFNALGELEIDPRKGSGGMTVGEWQDILNEKKNYWDRAITRQMEEALTSAKRLEAYEGANFDDGISLEDIFSTVGNTLPHIALATAGTMIAGPGVGFGSVLAGEAGFAAGLAAYTGTIAMGLQMYGDNYNKAIEQNLINKGLGRDAIRKALLTGEDAEKYASMNAAELNTIVEEKYAENLIGNYSTGEGAHIGKSAALAALQTAMESYGAQQIVGGLQNSLLKEGAENWVKKFSIANIASATWDDIGAGLYRFAVLRGGPALEEFGTEYMQEVLGQMSTGWQTGEGVGKYVNADEALKAGIGGGISGFMIPFSGDIITQSKVAIRETAASIALRYGGDSKYAQRVAVADNWFKQSKQELDDALAEKRIDQKEYNEKVRALSNVRNAGLKLNLFGNDSGLANTQMSKQDRQTLMDLYIDMGTLDQEIELAKDNEPLKNALKAERKILADAATEIIIANRNAMQQAKAESLAERRKTKGMGVNPFSNAFRNRRSGREEEMDLTEKSAEELVAEYELDNQQKDDYSKLERLRIKGVDSNTQAGFDQIIAAGAGIIENAFQRLYQKGSMATPQQFKQELQNEFVKVYDSYTTAKDKNNLGIGKQTSNLFNLRANAVATRNIRQQGDTISMSDEKAPQIGDTTEQTDFDATDKKIKSKRDKRYLGGNEKVNNAVGAEAKNEIKEETKKEILSQVNKGSTINQIKSAINNMFGDAKGRGGRGLWNILGNKIGSFKKGYQDFVDNVVDADFIKALPAAYIKSSTRLSKILGVEKLGKTDKVTEKDGKKSYSRPDVFSLGEITDDVVQQVKDYFKESNPTRLSLLKKMSGEFAMESLQELKADKNFMKTLDTALDGRMTAEEFMNQLEASMDQRTAEDTSLDIDKDTVNKSIKENLSEEDLNDPEIVKKLSRAIRKLEDFRKSSLTFGGLNAVLEASLRVARGLIKGGLSFAKAIRGVITNVKNALKNKTANFTFPTLFKRGEPGKAMRDLVSDIEVDFKASDGRTYRIQGPLDPKNKIHKEFLRDFIINKAYPVLPQAFFAGGNFGYNRGSMEGSYFFTKEELTEIRKEAKAKHKLDKSPEAIAKRKLIDFAFKSKSSYFKNDNGKFNSADYKKRMKMNYDGVELLLNDMTTLAKSDPAAMLLFEHVLKNASSTGASHFLRNFAMPVGNTQAFIDNNFVGRKEHVWPSNNVALFMLQAIKNDAVSDLMPLLRSSYYQFGITIDEDNKLKDTTKPYGDHTYLMDFQTKGFVDSVLAALNAKNPKLLLNPLVRYFNNMVNGNESGGSPGFNSNQLYLNDKSVASQYTRELDVKDQNADNLHYQNELTYLVLTNRMTQKEAVRRLNEALELNNAKAARAELNAENFPVLKPNQRSWTQKGVMLTSLAAKIKALKVFKKRKGLSAFDMDDTLALTKEKVLYTMPDGKKGELTAAQFATQYESLLEQGAEFDFSNFDNVDLSTPKGPLAGKALARQAKYGAKDIYIVTARPKASQEAIKLWADSIGLNIPIENIITLEDGSPQAKADWLLKKAEQGYNDFYFADDSALNVQVVKDILSQIDVKSKVQQAVSDKATDIDSEMNNLIEDATGMDANMEVSDVEARLEGKKRDKGFLKRILRQFQITASADDFLGLAYRLFGFAEKGTKQQQWFIENFVKPYNKAEQALISAKIAVMHDFAALKAALPKLKNYGVSNRNNPLNDQVGYKSYTVDHAIRVYIWNKQGMDIPGMTKTDIDNLVNAVESESQYQVFADELILIQKQGEFPGPSEYWMAGNIESDIIRGIDTTLRSQLLTEWQQNVDIAFSDKNMNKLEAAFGAKYVEALRDSLKRMKSGSNRPTYQGSGSRQVNEMLDWLNGSVAVAMFVNMRSGLLQMLSNVNFINWGDNNIYAAAKAFFSKDYVPTVIKLLNSDYLVNRRDGLKINVNEAELAAAAKTGGFKGMLNYLLDKGFVLTRIFDSLAIATGGATFYINRVKATLKRINPDTGKLYTQAEAEAKAFDDFYAIAEETQQSSNPSKISSQQASIFGRVILSFQNVTMQYNRKAKKMLLDLINRRKRPGMTQRESDLSNLSGVIYYVGMQNLIFNALQQALFALAFDDEDDKNKKEKEKVANTINGMLDSLLFGLGFGGAIISTVKNVSLEILAQHEKKTPKYEEAVWKLFDISPVIDQKVRNVRTALRTFSWNRKEMEKRGWDIENPAYLAVAQLISAFTNIPLDRALRKYNNISQAFDEETRTFERIALILGWNGWNFGLPYWGRESTIKREAEEEEKLKEKFKTDVRKFKAMGFTKRIPFTGENSWANGIPKNLKEGIDYVAIERYDGVIQYYKKP
jgi:hypothetical protein